MLLLLFLAGSNGYAQKFTLKGNVYDSSKIYPLESVSVLTSAGRGTLTNSSGHYEIEVSFNDSIWFSYLNKPTMKYPVSRIKDFTQFGFTEVLFPELDPNHDD